MTRKREFSKHSIDFIESPAVLHDCVRRALCLRRARLHAVVAAVCIASVAPLALGAAFPPVFPLARLYPAAGGDGSRGIVLPGINAGDSSGESVSAAGDVNGDGIDDVIVGAPGAGYGDSDAGESYVVFGRAAAP